MKTAIYWNTGYFKTPINLTIALFLVITHIFCIYGFYLGLTGQTMWQTMAYHTAAAVACGFGMTIGSHRLYSHKSYKPNKTIEAFLIFLANYYGEYSCFNWARYHRVHHKFSDTDADPQNIRRGLVFAQIGWYCLKRTEEFKEKVKLFDFSDLTNNKLLMLQHRYHKPLLFLQWTASALIPTLFWGESLFISTCTLCFALVKAFHHVNTINSICHNVGLRPYTAKIEPSFSRLANYLTGGEGYHNFHHTFPNDYSGSELKWTEGFNISTLILDSWSYMGWISNAKRVDPEIVRNRRLKTGDMSADVRPKSVILDYIFGFFVVSWGIWVVLSWKLFKRFVLKSIPLTLYV